jgi:hypothetical protein
VHHALVAQGLDQADLAQLVLVLALVRADLAQAVAPASVALAQAVPAAALAVQALALHARVVAQVAEVAALEPLVLLVKVAAAVPVRPASQSVRNAKSSNSGQRQVLAVP